MNFGRETQNCAQTFSDTQLKLKLMMFSLRPNPNYVPGGVDNFWISGDKGPPTGKIDGNGVNSALVGTEGGGGVKGFGAERSFFASFQSKDEARQEQAFHGIVGFMEKVLPLTNNSF